MDPKDARADQRKQCTEHELGDATSRSFSAPKTPIQKSSVISGFISVTTPLQRIRKSNRNCLVKTIQ